jgi:2-hydroxy-3-oxopropionate reductase
MKKIGFIGLGIMGRPMAVNLIRAGYSLVILERHAGVLGVDAVVEIAGSPKDLAAASDVIICMLPDAPQIREVVFGASGVIEGLRSGQLFIDMSTTNAGIEQEIAEAFAARGVETLDAPVSGGQTGAVSASLSIMVGGEVTAVERAWPLFEVLGKKINHMGGHGAGQITKSCNQIATALATQGIVEAFSLARQSGIDLGKLREVMSGGFADSRALLIAGDKMIRRDFAPGFKLSLYRKDLGIAQKAGDGLALPGTGLVLEEMDMLLEEGKGGLDFSALIQVFE